MRHRLSLIPLLLTLVVALTAGVPAVASASYKQIYNDCTDGTLDGHYSLKELNQALQNLEANLSDYSECSDVIVAAQQAAAAGTETKRGTKTSGSGATGTAGSGGGSSTGGGTGAGTSTGGGSVATTTPNPLDDARNADAAEQTAAVAQATQAASADAGKEAADLKDASVPAAALQLGSSDNQLPLPLLLTLIVCVVAACVAGGTTGLQALRRRRGR